MVDIIDLKNPNAVLLPDVSEFLDKAFKSVSYSTPKDKMSRAIGVDGTAIFLAREEGKWSGMAWVEGESWRDDNTALVLHFYSCGTRSTKEALIKAVVDFARESGAEKLLAWDMNRKPGAFARTFRSAGTVKETMRAYEFDLNNARV